VWIRTKVKGQNGFLDLLGEYKKTKFSFLQSYKPQMKITSRTQLPSININTKQSHLKLIIIPSLLKEAQPPY